MMDVLSRRHNQLNFGFYYNEMYLCFVIGFFFLPCTHGTPWANYSAVFPAMLQSGKNTVSWSSCIQ